MNPTPEAKEAADKYVMEACQGDAGNMHKALCEKDFLAGWNAHAALKEFRCGRCGRLHGSLQEINWCTCANAALQDAAASERGEPSVEQVTQWLQKRLRGIPANDLLFRICELVNASTADKKEQE